MKERNVTGYRLNKDCGVDGSRIAEWSSGKSKPSANTIIKLAQYFNVSTDYLLMGEDAIIGEINYKIGVQPVIDRLQKFASVLNITIEQILDKCDIDKNAFSNWQTRKAEPSTGEICRLAEYFNVSTDYLFYGKDFAPQAYSLSRQEKQMLEKFNNLDDKQKQVALDSLDLQLKYSSKADNKNKQA